MSWISHTCRNFKLGAYAANCGTGAHSLVLNTSTPLELVWF